VCAKRRTHRCPVVDSEHDLLPSWRASGRETGTGEKASQGQMGKSNIFCQQSNATTHRDVRALYIDSSPDTASKCGRSRASSARRSKKAAGRSVLLLSVFSAPSLSHHNQELSHLSNSFAQLKQAQAKFRSCIESAKEVKRENKGTSSTYLRVRHALG
jgi:hypothetical protein